MSSKSSAEKSTGDGKKHFDNVDIPNEFIQYITYLKKLFDEKNVLEMQVMYEQGLSEMTEKHYPDKTWPEPSVIENIIDETGSVFNILYRELYYRDVHIKTSARGIPLCARYDSFMNYQDLFSCILNTPDGKPAEFVLPDSWIWDIIEEFIHQFVMYCGYKANPSHRTPDENRDLEEIENNQTCWNVYPVLNILYSLISKSQINEQLKAIREGENPDDFADNFGKSDLYFKLGYFSLIGLLKIQVLLSDYHQALQTVEYLEMDPKGLYNMVTNCYVNLHYYVAFSHMMMRNYGEATKIFVNCLLYIQKATNIYKFNNSNVQRKYNPLDFIIKTHDQMISLLCICLALHPQKIEESIQQIITEKLGDVCLRMINGEMEEYQSCFLAGAPKFISPTTVAYEGPSVSRQALMRQCNAFMQGLKGQIWLPILRSYLKLYTSISTKKLAGFLEMGDDKHDEFVTKLLSFKMIVSELGKETAPSNDKNDIDDTTLDLDFYVDDETIHVADTRIARKITEFFLKSSVKLRNLTQKAKSIRIPPPKRDSNF
uniref:Eukaryotic translation initiation factor 3 subunit L n=1 Tax=Strongyloides papillosus TaxID=174720 RepID=A0A0N5BGA7_STREA